MLLIYRILFSFSCNNTLGLSTVSKAEKGIWKGWLVSITTKYKEECLPFFTIYWINLHVHFLLYHIPPALGGCSNQRKEP
uniref:Uncharacterized protein n=1 Tax=Solanum tuberosum TaxID=4113 RepID=M1CB26_SOLTU